MTPENPRELEAQESSMDQVGAFALEIAWGEAVSKRHLSPEALASGLALGSAIIALRLRNATLSDATRNGQNTPPEE